MKYLILATMAFSLSGCSFMTAEKVTEDIINEMEDELATRIADKVVDRLENHK